MIKKYLNSDSNLIRHALREFRCAGWMDEGGEFICDEEEGFRLQELVCCDVLELLEVLSSQDHSGSSGGYALSLFEELARFKPISPLNETDDEWTEVSEGLYQNKRCSHVFKSADLFDGQAYDLDAIIFRDKDGNCFTNGDSRRPITFPYMPHSEYVDVDGDEKEGGRLICPQKLTI